MTKPPQSEGPLKSWIADAAIRVLAAALFLAILAAPVLLGASWFER